MFGCTTRCHPSDTLITLSLQLRLRMAEKKKAQVRVWRSDDALNMWNSRLSLQAKKDAEDAKANEAIRRKGGKDQAQIKAELALKEAVSPGISLSCTNHQIDARLPSLRRKKPLSARRTKSTMLKQKPQFELRLPPTKKHARTKPLARKLCEMAHHCPGRKATHRAVWRQLVQLLHPRLRRRSTTRLDYKSAWRVEERHWFTLCLRARLSAKSNSGYSNSVRI